MFVKPPATCSGNAALNDDNLRQFVMLVRLLMAGYVCGLRTVHLWIPIRWHCYDLWTCTWRIWKLRIRIQQSTDRDGVLLFQAIGVIHLFVIVIVNNLRPCVS